MHQYAAGGAAHQCRHVGAAVGRRQRRRVVESDTVDDAHVHVDDLEALPAVGQAGDDLRFLADVGGVPQAVGAIRGRTFGGRERLGSAVAGGDAGGQLVDHPVLHRQHPPQRPGQPQVQAGAEHRDRLAEALVDAPCIHADLAYAAEQPAGQRHHRQHRQERPPHETEGPDLAQVDAEALVQLMLQTLQGTRRPAQQVGQQAGGDQARFEAGTLRREHRQDRPAQQLQRQRRRQQAEQYRQTRGPGVSLASQEQTEGGQHQSTDQRPRQLPEGRGFRPLRRPLAGEATFQHQHREGQQQADTDGEVGGLPGTGRRQVETPAGGYQAQRQRRARRQPQRSVPELGQAVGDGLAQALQQPFIGAVGGGVGFVPLPAQPGRPRAGLCAEDHATPGRDPIGRVQTGEQYQPGRAEVVQQRRPERVGGEQADEEPQHGAGGGQCDAGCCPSPQLAQLPGRLLETRQRFGGDALGVQVDSHLHSRKNSKVPARPTQTSATL